MTVQELISELQKCEPEAIVFVFDITTADEPTPVHSLDNGLDDGLRVDINFGE